MTTTPEDPSDGTQDDPSPDASSGPHGAETPGAEIGVSEGEGSTFEPEEDPEGHG